MQFIVQQVVERLASVLEFVERKHSVLIKKEIENVITPTAFWKHKPVLRQKNILKYSMLFKSLEIQILPEDQIVNYIMYMYITLI